MGVMPARHLLPALGCLLAAALWIGLDRDEPAADTRPASKGARYALDAAQGELEGRPTLGSARRRRGLRFEAGVQPLDRQAILTAVASTRPEARRLIDLVDGLVTVRVGPIGGQAVGVAKELATGYEVALDLGPVASRFGQRGIDNVVLHELAHVVDFAIVPDDLLATIDAATARGYGCQDAEVPAGAGCASREERFADSFAKWATGDIGVDLYLGYKVPPPSGGWGDPLLTLGR